MIDDDDDIGRGPLGWQGCSMLSCSGLVMIGLFVLLGKLIAGWPYR